MPPLSKGPPAKLVPASTTKLPAPRRGDLRVDIYGVDVTAPADAFMFTTLGIAEISWTGCEVQLRDGTADDNVALVGTLRLVCAPLGDRCGNVCRRIRPIPGGVATEPYPSEIPVIELTRWEADNGKGSENIFIWRDGTVQLDGEDCRGAWRARRATLPPARVAELVDVLDRGGFFDHEVVEAKPTYWEDDHIGGRLVVRDHAMQWNGATIDDVLSAARDRVYEAVGNNPCTGGARDRSRARARPRSRP